MSPIIMEELKDNADQIRKETVGQSDVIKGMERIKLIMKTYHRGNKD